MLPADEGSGGGVDLKRGLEALETFKKRVDTVLTNFNGSAGSSRQIGDNSLSPASFSGSSAFAEATGLHAQYERVHEHLTSLSKNLGRQIEALYIAVHAADVGFDNLEEDLRHRFWTIQTDIARDEKEAARVKAQAAGGGKRSDDKQFEGGY